MNTKRLWSAYQFWMLMLGAGLVVGLVAAYNIFTRGLVVTNLTDLVPWGLWITIDLSSIALSAGAFMLSAIVYLLGLKQYHVVARTAIFVGFVGYSVAMICLLIDIGRPDRFWHGFVFWNPHSPLWEVTMCVGLYFSVLTLEVAPIVARLEWLKKHLPFVVQLLERIHHLAPGLAVAGLLLSGLHQSSLGATYGVLNARPIWYRPGLAVLFIVSAMAAGPAFTLLVSMLAERITPRARVDDQLIDSLAHAVGWILVAYFYLRLWDMLSMHYTFQPGRNEGLELLTSGTLSFTFWVGEIIGGIVLPAILLLGRSTRKRPGLRMLALVGVVIGLIAYRWDTNMVGQLVVSTFTPQTAEPFYTSYRPGNVEIAAAIGIISYGLLAITVGIRYLGIVDHGVPAAHVAESAPAPQLALGSD